MAKTKDKGQEKNTSEWVAQIQIGIITAVNTYIFFASVNQFQSSFWRVIKVQSFSSFLLGLLYSLFFFCIFASYSNLYLALRGEKNKQQKDPIPGAYSMTVASLVFYLFTEVLLNFLIAQNTL